MANNKFILGVVIIFGITSILADVPTPIDPQEAELDALLRRSEEQLRKVEQVAKQVDNIASAQVAEMKESIEQLQEQNKQLQNEIAEVKDSIQSNIINSSPFELGPILPNTTSGGK